MGRFTDPHPLTCYNITPSVCWLMFAQCPLPSALSKPDLRVEKNSLFNEANPALLCAAFAGPAGPAFSFSAFLLPARPLACVDRAGFLSSRFAAVPDSSITGSHGLNRAGLQLRWCRSPTRPPKLHTRPHRAGLGLRWCRFPTLGSNRHTGANRAEFGFSPQNEHTPPPKGGGAGYHLTWLAGILMQRNPVLFRRKRGTLRIRRLL